MRNHPALLDHPIGFPERDGRHFDPITALVVAGSTLAGAAISSSASKSAASTQANAANRATDIQNQQWQQTQANLKPYMDLGQSYINPLQRALGMGPDGTVDQNNPLQQRFAAPTADQAAQTPGYQFTLNQGLKAAQSSAAARGLGTSGAALKGASTYATGLADSTYNDVYQRALNTFNTNYKSASDNAARMQGMVSNGQNASAGLGALGAQTSGSIANTLMSGANAQAAGTIGSANALTSALGGMGNNAMFYGMMQNNAGGGITNAQVEASHSAEMSRLNNQLMTG